LHFHFVDFYVAVRQGAPPVQKVFGHLPAAATAIGCFAVSIVALLRATCAARARPPTAANEHL